MLLLKMSRAVGVLLDKLILPGIFVSKWCWGMVLFKTARTMGELVDILLLGMLVVGMIGKWGSMLDLLKSSIVSMRVVLLGILMLGMLVVGMIGKWDSMLDLLKPSIVPMRVVLLGILMLDMLVGMIGKWGMEEMDSVSRVVINCVLVLSRKHARLL